MRPRGIRAWVRNRTVEPCRPWGAAPRERRARGRRAHGGRAGWAANRGSPRFGATLCLRSKTHLDTPPHLSTRAMRPTQPKRVAGLGTRKRHIEFPCALALARVARGPRHVLAFARRGTTRRAMAPTNDLTPRCECRSAALLLRVGCSAGARVGDRGLLGRVRAFHASSAAKAAPSPPTAKASPHNGQMLRARNKKFCDNSTKRSLNPRAQTYVQDSRAHLPYCTLCQPEDAGSSSRSTTSPSAT